MGKFLISAGVLLVIAGLLVEFGEKFLPLGHLPGDIHITSEHGSIYFPVVTCVVNKKHIIIFRACHGFFRGRRFFCALLL